MGFNLGDALKFESFQISDWWDKIKDNPEQLLLGAATPVGAELWGGILGKDYDPLVNEFGGPTDDVWRGASEAGIDTSSAEGPHAVAEGISKIYAGNYLGNATGLLGGGGQSQPDNSAHQQALELERLKRQSARGLL